MKIIPATIKDLNQILDIYAFARESMRINNNPHQWGNDKPVIEDLINDINNSNLYLIKDEKTIIGVFAFICGIDPTYINIEGKWLSNTEYGTIHRIAKAKEGKNILKLAIEFGFTKVDAIRIDTHKDNLIMRNLLTRYGFTYCGIIYLKDGNPRMAFEKVRN